MDVVVRFDKEFYGVRMEGYLMLDWVGCIFF